MPKLIKQLPVRRTNAKNIICRLYIALSKFALILKSLYIFVPINHSDNFKNSRNRALFEFLKSSQAIRIFMKVLGTHCIALIFEAQIFILKRNSGAVWKINLKVT